MHYIYRITAIKQTMLLEGLWYGCGWFDNQVVSLKSQVSLSLGDNDLRHANKDGLGYDLDMFQLHPYIIQNISPTFPR